MQKYQLTKQHDCWQWKGESLDELPDEIKAMHPRKRTENGLILDNKSAFGICMLVNDWLVGDPWGKYEVMSDEKFLDYFAPNKASISMLQPERPLVCFDLETTGLNTNWDKIVSIAMIKILPSGKKKEYYTLINPECKIPRDSTAIHGITDDDVKNAPKFSEIAGSILEYLLDSDYHGYNITGFDIHMLEAEFNRCGLKWDYRSSKIFDSQKIFRNQVPHTLIGASKFYCNFDHSEAHNALEDTRATVKVLEAQLVRHNLNWHEAEDQSKDEGQADLAGKLKYDEDGDLIFNFGKHKGAKVINQRDYATWMIRADFAQETKDLLEKELNRY